MVEKVGPDMDIQESNVLCNLCAIVPFLWLRLLMTSNERLLKKCLYKESERVFIYQRFGINEVCRSLHKYLLREQGPSTISAQAHSDILISIPSTIYHISG